MTEEQEQKPAMENGGPAGADRTCPESAGHERFIQKNPHVYKPTYTKQEVDELARWFEERMERLPVTLRLNEATTTFDLPRTVRGLLAVLKVHKKDISVTFSGYVAHLELIRLRLKEQGFE